MKNLIRNKTKFPDFPLLFMTNSCDVRTMHNAGRHDVSSETYCVGPVNSRRPPGNESESRLWEVLTQWCDVTHFKLNQIGVIRVRGQRLVVTFTWRCCMLIDAMIQRSMSPNQTFYVTNGSHSKMLPRFQSCRCSCNLEDT